MKTLKNGALVIERSGRVVLAQWKGSEFVTWNIDSDGNAYWGHYFKDITSAAEDFLIRKAGA